MKNVEPFDFCPVDRGDTIYWIFHGYIEELPVVTISYRIMTKFGSIYPEDIGRTVFLTQEMAEAKLHECDCN